MGPAVGETVSETEEKERGGERFAQRDRQTYHCDSNCLYTCTAAPNASTASVSCWIIVMTERCQRECREAVNDVKKVLSVLFLCELTFLCLKYRVNSVKNRQNKSCNNN